VERLDRTGHLYGAAVIGFNWKVVYRFKSLAQIIQLCSDAENG